MTFLAKEFTFAADAESWAFTVLDSASGSYVSGDGNPSGSIDIDNRGRNANDTTGYWEWTGTFEDLGVPVGATVNGYSSGTLDWKCSYFMQVDALTSGPFTINDGTLRTIVAGASITGTGSFTAANQSGTVTGLSLASTTSVVLRITCDSDCGNNASAGTTVLFDNVTIGIDYTAGAGGGDEPLATLQTIDRGLGLMPAARLGGVLQ